MKKGYAAFEFKYKNCFNGTDILDPEKDPKLELEFQKGDKLPEVLIKRLLMHNPEHVVFEKVKEEKEVEEVKEVKKGKVPRIYNKSEAIELNKKEQEDLLLSRGLTRKEVNELKIEESRVKKILETNPKVEE